MKKEIHPEYMETKVTCGACGNTFTVRSNKPELEVEICNKCHSILVNKVLLKRLDVLINLIRNTVLIKLNNFIKKAQLKGCVLF